MADSEGLITKGLRVRMRFATDERLVASVHRGDPLAFEAVYERHAGELLSFCVYMLGSRQDAEDAVQATFASAYRALRANQRKIALRPWLFTIARNESVNILRTRRPTVELNGEPALGGDPLRELEVREQVRHVLEDLRKLPEEQRAALVLAEMHGHSQADIGTVLGVRPEQVKAYVFQARSNLLSERRARETDCSEIREELASARGAALLRGRLRRHLRSCQDCRVYADGVARQRRQLGALLPLAPSLVLKSRALRSVLETGIADPAPYAGGAAVTGSVVGAAVGLAGGGMKAAAVKLATGLACVCASVGVGASVIDSHQSVGQTEGLAAAAASAQLSPVAVLTAAKTLGLVPGGAGLVEALPTSGKPVGAQPRKAREPDGSATVLAALPAEPLTTAVAVARGPSGRGGRTSASRQEQAQSEQERQRKHEESQRESEAGQREHEEHLGEREERKGEREAQKGEREAHKQEREQVKQNPEEGDQIGDSRPPKNEEERQLKRAERQHVLEERELIQHARPPPTEEQLQRRRERREERERVGSRPPDEEERQRKREERQRLREETQPGSD
jgi:RNA polymerase sigma factor (sigma-70 family)